MAKVGRRVQNLYSPCPMSLTSQAHVGAHAATLLPLFPQVAALMGRVVHVQLFYGVVKEAAEGFVVVTGADLGEKFTTKT